MEEVEIRRLTFGSYLKLSLQCGGHDLHPVCVWAGEGDFKTGTHH